MNMPLHPMITHFPIALSFILPLMVLSFAWLIKLNKLTPKGWLIIIALQLTTTISGYVALETGENEEAAVEKVLAKKLINQHEEAAEIFVGSTVLGLVLGIAVFFIRYEYQFPIKIMIAAIALVSCYLAWNTGRLGGEMVYAHGAAEAYINSGGVEDVGPVGILPTPDLNTSESSEPATEDNESLSRDENDYGTTEDSEVDEEVKAED